MTKKEDKSKPKELPIEGKIVDVKGKEIPIKNIIKSEDTWVKENKRTKAQKRIISNLGVQKLAKAAGIEMNYKVKESQMTIPKPENSFLHIVEITIRCHATAKAKNDAPGCLHDPYSTELTMTGEADLKNTGKGGTYLRMMAEKRGYDRAVLRHLGVMGVLSEVEASALESDEEKQKVDVIEPDDLKKIVDLVNGILMSKTKDELIEVGNIIKTTKESYNDTQIAYLRELYKKANSRYTETF